MIRGLFFLIIFLISIPFLYAQSELQNDERCNYAKRIKKYQIQDSIQQITDPKDLFEMGKCAIGANERELAKKYYQRILDQEALKNKLIYYQTLVVQCFNGTRVLNLDTLKVEVREQLGRDHDLLAVIDLVKVDKQFQERKKIKLDSIMPDILSRIKDKSVYKNYIATALQGMSKDFSDKSKPKQAMSAALQMKDFVISNYPDCSFQTLSLYLTLGRRHLDIGNLDSATYYFAQSYEQTKLYHPYDFQTLSMMAINLADVEEQKGAYQKALKILNEVEGYLEKDSSAAIVYLPNIYNAMGINYKELKNRYKAIDYFRKTILFAEKASPGPSVKKLVAYSNISSEFLDIRELNLAENYAKKALDISYEILGEQHRFTAILLMKIGSINLTKREYGLAESYFERSLNLRKRLYGEHHNTLANVFINYSILYRDQEQYGKSISYIEKAIRIYRNQLGTYNQSIVDAYAQKSNTEFITGHYKAALASIEAAKQALICEGDFKSCADPIRYMELLDAEARLNFFNYTENGIGDLEEVLNMFEAVMVIFEYHIKMTEQVNDISELAANYESLFDYYVDALVLKSAETNDENYVKKAFTINDKGKNLGLYKSLDQRSQLLFSNIPKFIREELSSLKGKIKSIDQKLSRVKLEEQEKQTVLLDTLNNLLDRLSELNTQIKINYPAYNQLRNTNQSINFDAIIPETESGLAIVDYRILDSILISFSLYHGAIHVQRKKISPTFADELKHVLDRILKNKNDFLNNADEIQVLIQPIIDLPNDIRQIIIIPDEYLSALPFELLKINGVSLINTYAISYANSASILKIQREMNALGRSNNFAGFAPNYSTSIDTTHSKIYADLVRSGNWSLPYAQEEVDNISRLFDGNVFNNEKATKLNFFEAIRNTNIVHLSMHAEVDDDAPMNSRFIFNTINEEDDENLLLYELYNLQANANMVVLSACETGKGIFHKGDGVRSLGNGFLYAGVPSVVMSLWKVPDESTSKIMIAFYKYLKKGQSKSTALQNAKLDYLKNTIAVEQQHPYYWAGFILSGNNDPINLDMGWRIKPLLLFFLLGIFLFWILIKRPK